MTKEKIIPMDGNWHPLGTLMYFDETIHPEDADWQPHRSIWRVIGHREYEDYPGSPIRLVCSIVKDRAEELI